MYYWQNNCFSHFSLVKVLSIGCNNVLFVESFFSFDCIEKKEEPVADIVNRKEETRIVQIFFNCQNFQHNCEKFLLK